MNLSHFSSKPLESLRSVTQGWDDDYRSCYAKPKGLWVSVDGEDDWPSWCESESFGLGQIRHRVILQEDHNVLLITSEEALRAFSKEWQRFDNEAMNRVYRLKHGYIDWPGLAAAYDGLIIAPYIWQCRFDLNWYYGWDCASGCIWHAGAIASVAVMTEAKAA